MPNLINLATLFIKSNEQTQKLRKASKFVRTLITPIHVVKQLHFFNVFEN